MLKDELIKYYYPPNGHNYNCAEAMLRAVNDYYKLDLPEKMLYSVSGFGGGAGHDLLCGGLQSAIITLGVLFSVNGRGHDSELLNQLTDRLLNEFAEKMGHTDCVFLKSHYHVPVHKCESVLVKACDILEELISENSDLINRFD